MGLLYETILHGKEKKKRTEAEAENQIIHSPNLAASKSYNSGKINQLL